MQMEQAARSILIWKKQGWFYGFKRLQYFVYLREVLQMIRYSRH